MTEGQIQRKWFRVKNDREFEATQFELALPDIGAC